MKGWNKATNSCGFLKMQTKRKCGELVPAMIMKEIRNIWNFAFGNIFVQKKKTKAFSRKTKHNEMFSINIL